METKCNTSHVTLFLRFQDVNGCKRSVMQSRSSAERESREMKVLAGSFFCPVAGLFFLFSFQGPEASVFESFHDLRISNGTNHPSMPSYICVRLGTYQQPFQNIILPLQLSKLP